MKTGRTVLNFVGLGAAVVVFAFLAVRIFSLGPAPLIYSCLMIIFTFATWILFYQN